MTTLNLLKLLENAGFGKIDENLFWNKMGLGKNGIYIADLGASNDRGQRKVLSYELYSRADNDVKAYNQLQDVIDFLNQSFGSVCVLPAVDGISEKTENVTIMPLSTIANNGEDSNGRLIFTATGTIYY